VETPKASPGADHPAAPPHPLFVALGQPFRELFGIARSTQAELIRKGELRSVLVGETRGRRLIEVRSWYEYIDRQRRREAVGIIGVNSPNPNARERQTAAAPTHRAGHSHRPQPHKTPAAQGRQHRARRTRRKR
jgi:hypothetical protein